MLKLSEAIRLGAMMKPQIQGGLYSFKPRGILGLTEERIGTCALGAAFEAAGCGEGPARGGGISTRDGVARTTAILVPPEWWSLLVSERPCPVCAVELHTTRVISHLNDDHRWTREQIADWVETVEAAQSTEEPPSTNAVDPSAQRQESDATRV